MSLILLVEDDPAIRDPLATFLRQAGFEVVVASDLKTASEHLSPVPDLVILDWNLPDGQGIDLLRSWRTEGRTTPFIFLTARTELQDKILGLNMGANDYLAKPFEPSELLARIGAQLRSHSNRSTETDEILIFGKLTLNLASREAEFDRVKVPLKKMEFELLKLFLQFPKRVFTRDELLNRVWGYQSAPSTRTVDTHVLQLRQKFGSEVIQTHRGSGYRLGSLTLVMIVSLAMLLSVVVSQALEKLELSDSLKARRHLQAGYRNLLLLKPAPEIFADLGKAYEIDPSHHLIALNTSEMIEKVVRSKPERLAKGSIPPAIKNVAVHLETDFRDLPKTRLEVVIVADSGIFLRLGLIQLMDRKNIVLDGSCRSSESDQPPGFPSLQNMSCVASLPPGGLKTGWYELTLKNEGPATEPWVASHLIFLDSSDLTSTRPEISYARACRFEECLRSLRWKNTDAASARTQMISIAILAKDGGRPVWSVVLRDHEMKPFPTKLTMDVIQSSAKQTLHFGAGEFTLFFSSIHKRTLNGIDLLTSSAIYQPLNIR